VSLISRINSLATRIGTEFKSIRTEFISKTNTTSYTPTTDYHPATKKYVDDNAGSGGASVAIDDTTPAGSETMWYQPTKGVFSLLIDSQWVSVGRNGADGADGADGTSVAIDDTAPTGSETMWYQPTKGVFSLLVDSQWVSVSRNGADGADGTNALGFIAAILTKSVDQNVGGANGTETWWTWNGETRKDNEFIHDNSTNSERVAIATTGWYNIMFNGSVQQTGTGRSTLQGIIRINSGSTLRTGTVRDYSRGSAYGNLSPGLSCTMQLTSGDYIEVGTRVEDSDGVYTLSTNGAEINSEENQLIITRLE